MKQLLSFFGHHKAGTKWMLSIIQEVCELSALKHYHYHSPKQFSYDLEKEIIKKKIDFLSFTIADYSYTKNINALGFHIIRDPRDIVVSSYFSHRNSHPDDEWPEVHLYREKLLKLSKEEGILETMKDMQSLIVDGIAIDLYKTMNDWNYSQSQVMEIKFENLILNPEQTIISIFNHLNLIDSTIAGNYKILKHALISSLSYRGFVPSFLVSKKIPLWRLREIINKNSFEKKSEGRATGDENAKSHYRKGIAGDWKNHFTQEHKSFFKNNYNPLLVKLGYEKDDNW